MSRFGRWLGVVFVLLGTAAACSTQTDPAVDAATTVLGEEIEPAWPSFFFPQTPLYVDVPTPSPDQLAELDAADVPVDTRVFIATTGLRGSSSRTGEIRITDVMRGPRSEQDIRYVLPGTDGQTDAVVQSVFYDICDQPGDEPTVIRGSSEACVRSVAASSQARAWIEATWAESGVRYAANSSAAVSPAALIEWLDGLQFVELGHDGAPYSSPYCSENPGRCNR